MSKAKKPNKPYPGFPLTAHPVGQWCKMINYKTYYFGPWENPQGALDKFLNERDNIQAGRPRNTDTKPAGDVQPAGPTVKRLCDSFLTEKFHAVQSKELGERTFVMYRRACEKLAEKLGKLRLLSDLTTEDFQRLRSDLAVGIGLVSLANEIRAVRIIIKYGVDTGLIEQQLRLNVVFKAPKKTALRTEKNAKPARMLEADELRRVLAAAARQQRAMILLGINCGFGQADISALPEAAVNLDTGWVNFPRPKTAVKRRCPLWPETIAALREAFAKRPQATDQRAEGKAFITRTGTLYVRSIVKGEQIDSAVQVDGVALEFGKLLTKLKLKRVGLNFYCLRHGFETIAGEAGDQVAVNSVMGHVDSSMAAAYRERISDQRLERVVGVVRAWLWPQGSEAAWLAAEAERIKALEVIEESKNTAPKAGRKTKADKLKT